MNEKTTCLNLQIMSIKNMKLYFVISENSAVYYNFIRQIKDKKTIFFTMIDQQVFLQKVSNFNMKVVL